MKFGSFALLAAVLHWPLAAPAQQQQPSPPTTVEQMKSALVGKTMTAREKGWHFQSVEQIRDMVIKRIKEEHGRRRYEVTMLLRDPRVLETYKADAELTYRKTDSGWRLQFVGLKRMEKVP